MFQGFGDPARMIVGQTGDKKTMDNIRKDLYLDQPKWKQFILYLNDVSPICFHSQADIDKKKLVLEIYQKVFSINDTEKRNIAEQIDFLCDNNLISKVNGVKRNSKIFVNYIKSKL